MPRCSNAFAIEFERLQRAVEQVVILKPKKCGRQLRMLVQERPLGLFVLGLCPVEALDLIK